jgi:hypothetical protein
MYVQFLSPVFSLLRFELAIQELNAQLFAEQENQEDTDVDEDASEDEAQPKKKFRLDVVLDDDEAAALKDLTGAEEEDEAGPAMENDEEDDGAGVFEKDIIDLASGKKIPSKEPSEEPEDEDEEEEDVFGSNGVCVSYLNVHCANLCYTRYQLSI